MEEKNYTIALLIDTDNVSSKYMSALYNELISLGKVTYKRMYGDFTVPNASGWKKMVNEFAITPVQQFTYTTGKNATDFRVIIDAMDILYSGDVDAFCLMSSDSDFTGLAKRLKESNMFIIGAGEKKTPVAFVNACDRFFQLDKLTSYKEKERLRSVKKTTVKAEPVTYNEEESVEERSKKYRKENIEDLSIRILENTDGKPYALSALVSKIYQAYPQFNFKDYGVKKAQDFFDRDIFTISTGKTTEKYISLK
ncbi:MAG: NYN domain-containing protein [Clostridiales bacterium]|nr:NYN domain-containing protein [Clostridiales bacterium]